MRSIARGLCDIKGMGAKDIALVIPAQAGIQHNVVNEVEHRIFALLLRGLDPSLRWDDEWL